MDNETKDKLKIEEQKMDKSKKSSVTKQRLFLISAYVLLFPVFSIAHVFISDWWGGKYSITYSAFYTDSIPYVLAVTFIHGLSVWFLYRGLHIATTKHKRKKMVIISVGLWIVLMLLSWFVSGLIMLGLS